MIEQAAEGPSANSWCQSGRRLLNCHKTVDGNNQSLDPTGQSALRVDGESDGKDIQEVQCSINRRDEVDVTVLVVGGATYYCTVRTRLCTDQDSTAPPNGQLPTRLPHYLCPLFPADGPPMGIYCRT
jgi:hypothetical protein